jgi:glycerophosphoryl diester phosphodiesterase
MSDRSEGPSGPSFASPAAAAGQRPGAGRPVTVAHRAGNDRDALERALSAGVDEVEADLRWDGGRIVNRHDRRIPLLPVYWDRWHMRIDRGPQLTLDELLERMRGRSRPYLDLKSQSRPFLRALLETLRRHEVVHEAVISSGYWRPLDELRRGEGSLRLLRTIGDERQRADYLALAADDPLRAGVAIHHDLLDEELARLLRSRGVEVYVWAVDDVEEARRLVGLGATGIVADSLELLQAVKGLSMDMERTSG